MKTPAPSHAPSCLIHNARELRSAYVRRFVKRMMRKLGSNLSRRQAQPAI